MSSPADLAKKHNVLIVAAEASSALYATRLLQLWKKQGKGVHAFGIGSEQMVAEGFEAIGKSEELAVMGVVEVLKHFPLIRRTFHALLAAAKEKKPDFVLLLDYPDFNLRIAKKLKAMGIPVVYYISPQIWAWRTHRVEKMKSLVDKMLVLFPFERAFYEKHGIDCDFVGHPLLDEISDALFDETDIATERSKFGITPGQKLVGLMPGSRESEINHHLQTQLEVAAKLHDKDSELRFALLVAPTFTKEQIQDKLPDLNFPLILLKDEPFRMIRLTDVILTASGTATLLVGLMKKPMVIMYKMNSFTAMIAKKFVTHTQFFGMINLIFDKLVVPELFQEQANVDDLVSQMNNYLDNPEQLKATEEELALTFQRLGDRGATARVDNSLKEFWAQ